MRFIYLFLLLLFIALRVIAISGRALLGLALPHHRGKGGFTATTRVRRLAASGLHRPR